MRSFGFFFNIRNNKSFKGGEQAVGKLNEGKQKTITITHLLLEQVCKGSRKFFPPRNFPPANLLPEINPNSSPYPNPNTVYKNMQIWKI